MRKNEWRFSRNLCFVLVVVLFLLIEWMACAHVHGLGTFENGVEKPRARVTLATQIPPEQCKRINLGYRDTASIRVEEFANREDEGILLVPKAGEMLYRLKNPPAWASEDDHESRRMNYSMTK